MKNKRNVTKSEALLKKLGENDAVMEYIDCPACGGKLERFYEIPSMHRSPREVLICRSCGYIRDSH